MNLARSTFAVLAFALVLVAPASAFQFPLSSTSSRAAYFLGQRQDVTMGEFLARYSRNLPAPKSGPYVSDITLFTPFAQLVEYSSRQGVYNAQQAELDGERKFLSVEITVYLYFTATYGEMISDPPPTRSSGGIHFRSEIHLTYPAESFSSDSATVKVVTPNGQSLTAEFDLDALR